VTLGLGLGPDLKANIFGLGFEAQVLGCAACGLGHAVPTLALYVVALLTSLVVVVVVVVVVIVVVVIT